MSTLTRAGALLVGALLLLSGGCNSDGGVSFESVGDDDAFSSEWPTFGRTIERSSYAPDETAITAQNAGQLVSKWKFETGGPVAAAPVVATVDVNDQPVRLVIAGSYDGNVYAVRADDGNEVWRFRVKPHPGASYGAIVSTATVADVDGQQRVYVAGGQTMYALNAATGHEVWEFDAGTGCTTCDAQTERNEILSSPAVLPSKNMVLFGMDVNDSDPGKGGFYAISADEGALTWYFDLETGATCYPDGDDNVRKFDGYHTAHELGVEDDFFETREGCDFDRTQTGCGSVWSPVSVDMERELVYFSSSNCDTDDDPNTAEPPPPMPLYDEALVALNFDGTPAWTWRPREVDNADLAFGAAPNLFITTIEGEDRDVVGLGGKDGTYYLLDRDGENELTGEVEPYWSKNVVPGGSIGGATGSPSVTGDAVYFGTAIGESVDEFQKPSAWALDASTGELLWSSPDAPPFYGATTTVPGVVFMGGVFLQLHAYDATTGEMLLSRPLEALAFSAAAVVDGELFVGAGFGATTGATSEEEAQEAAEAPGAIWAFCIEGSDGCAPQSQ
jgi:polyvinyl alcohol dehydrogenase (cytochrome)